MELSNTPESQPESLYEEVFRGRPYPIPTDDIYSRTYGHSSSGSSSPSSNEMRRGGSSSRER